MSILRKSIAVIASHEKNNYFFSTNHCQDHGLDESYVPCTHGFPSMVVPREGFPTSCVDNVKDIVLVFYNDMVQIPNPNPEFQPRIYEFAYHTEKKVCDWIDHRPTWCGDCYACADCGIMFSIK